MLSGYLGRGEIPNWGNSPRYILGDTILVYTSYQFCLRECHAKIKQLNLTQP